MKPRITPKRSRFAQHPVAYITYANPQGVRQLLEQQGFVAPDNIHEVAQAIKELVQRKGRSVMPALLQHHPDRNAILKISSKGRCKACQADTLEDHYCGSCGHYQYLGGDDLGAFLERLTGMDRKALESYYEQAVKRANEAPEDPTLADEVQLIWNELRTRNAPPEGPSNRAWLPPPFMTRQGLTLLGLTLAAGILVGSSFKRIP